MYGCTVSPIPDQPETWDILHLKKGQRGILTYKQAPKTKVERDVEKEDMKICFKERHKDISKREVYKK